MPSIIKSLVQQEILLGKVVNLSKIGLKQVPCVQVRCQQNEFNDYIKKYHAKSYDYWALDTKSNIKVGDIVLIKHLESQSQKPSMNVAHQVDRVIFTFGNIIDPVTGRRVIENKFADEIEIEKKFVKSIVEEPEELPQCFSEVREVQKKKLSEEYSKCSSS
uniref:28S ribosomal protein S17, mitochondrial n=1 Tax=Parastrongyloides trichosuri TaxID=131310 RepID=A0A0N5A244_PARTI